MASNVTIKQKYPHESAESMLRRFKKKVEKAGVLQDMRKHEEYVAPAEKKRLKSKLARARVAKEERKKTAREAASKQF